MEDLDFKTNPMYGDKHYHFKYKGFYVEVIIHRVAGVYKDMHRTKCLLRTPYGTWELTTAINLNLIEQTPDSMGLKILADKAIESYEREIRKNKAVK
jgi:hypothetical protein